MDRIQRVSADFLPIVKAMVKGKYAVSIGGSVGKKVSDTTSDIDFRLWYESWIDDEAELERLREKEAEIIRAYGEEGIIIDGCWPRSIAEVEETIDTWYAGKGEPWDLWWTIWGYHPLTDIGNQYAVDDPYGLVAGWRKRLSSYPHKHKEKIVKKYANILKYWREDYHYVSKIKRRDVVFLAGLTAKLVHGMIQILYALNEKHYVGDGNNIKLMTDFKIIPKDFAQRVEDILLIGGGDERFSVQREMLCELIDEVLELPEVREII